MKNVLAQFLEIGAAGSSGTRSTSEDQSRLFELAVQSVAKQIVTTLQNTVVRALVDLNFTNAEYPTLRVSNISDDNVPVISDAIKKFVDAGVIQPRAEDENTVRRMVGWSELTEEEVKERADEVKAQKAEKAAPVKVTEDEKKEAEKLAADVSSAQALHASITRRLYDRPAHAA